MRKLPAVTAALMLLLGAVVGCSDVPASSGPKPTPDVSSVPAPAPDGELPRGGRQIFPKYQLVGYVGLPGSPALGPLDKDLEAKAATLETLATQYANGRTPQPVMELIAVVAN